MGRLLQVSRTTPGETLGPESDLERVFTYAKKWDFLLMAAAAIAAVGSGVVSPLPPPFFHGMDLLFKVRRPA